MDFTTTITKTLTPTQLENLSRALKLSASSTQSPAHSWFGDLAIFIPPTAIKSHPSVRLRRYNIRKPLRKLGIKADIIQRYDDLLPYRNIFFSHLDQDVAVQCQKLGKLRKRIFYVHTENIVGKPH